jgi:SAM-dependent methyltransferase
MDLIADPHRESDIFARAPESLTLADCDFYHVMDLPGVGLTTGQWDLRAGVNAYLGGFDFSGKRVLEIGPASGFLTFEMERRGAEVVSVEVTDEPGWDFVPFPETILEPMRAPRRAHMRRLKNSWWFVRRTLNGKAKMFYGDVYDLPDELGKFDVAVLAAVLLHTRSPVAIMAQCAKRANALLVVEGFCAGLEGRPVCNLVPSKTVRQYDTWWQFSTDFFRQYFGVLGFASGPPSCHNQPFGAKMLPQFTLIGRRED